MCVCVYVCVCARALACVCVFVRERVSTCEWMEYAMIFAVCICNDAMWYAVRIVYLSMCRDALSICDDAT